MKKIFFITLCTMGVLVLRAQSLDQGNKELYYEKYQSAEKTFQQLVHQDGNNAAAWYGLTRAELLQQKNKEALQLLQQAPASVQGQPYYQVAMGSVLLHEGKKDEASAYFNRALDETRQKDEGVLAAVAQSEVDADNADYQQAVDLTQKAIKRDKHNASYYVLLGDAWLKLQNGSEAYKAYKEAIDHDKNLASAYYRMGEIFLSQNNPVLYVDYFQKALAADPNYAPSLHKLYVYEFYHDPQKALDYYRKYVSLSDTSIQNQYDLADLLYVNKQYNEAISKANTIIGREGDSVQPRLYKLIGYSYAAQKDTADAVANMQRYFERQPDTSEVAKDYISMAKFYSATPGQDSMAVVYFEKGVAMEKDSSDLKNDYLQLANLNKNLKNYEEQAKWLGKYYTINDKSTNLDLFNWGLAYYRADDYARADSVFGLYASKYPDQSFGYYWQARSRALEDSTMQEGLAVPTYEKLVEVLEKNPSDPNYKKWLVDAYGYLATYETNTKKDYAQAKDYFEKILQVDPENADAKKYIDVLDKSVADKGTK